MYIASDKRYDKMVYRRVGDSGLQLPAISLGLWHNFGGVDALSNMEAMLYKAFDLGITHFDLANNYGPPPGSAEANFGRIMKKGFGEYRDEMIISTKAGYRMWPGPYGDGGSRKYMIASLDASLKRMGLDYVDIYYSHRPDDTTPLEETMGALDSIVRSGKALYVGISSYSPEQSRQAFEILKQLGTPCLIHQPVYNMFNRWVEDGLLDLLEQEKVGSIAFSPLAQGLLSEKYLTGIPTGSRADKPTGFLKRESVTHEVIAKVTKLGEIAIQRGQSLAQMSLAWVLREGRVTSALVGASSPAQIEQNAAAILKLTFSKDELKRIEDILAQ
ncbi:MAG: L-glyceraldehyde 3-phosphate reductase [Saccharofermentanales bacterium]